jgi:HD-like signal output (HDOD) protein
MRTVAKPSPARVASKVNAPIKPFEHTPEGIVAHLREAVRQPDYSPPMLSGVALQLVELSRDPDVDLAKVRTMMEREPLIAARVMSIAQSPFYSRGAPVESLDEALVRLGVKRLTGIFMEAAMKASVLDSKAFEAPMEQLRRHSTATAHIARGVCRSLKQPGDRAFICGLLHDIGTAACLGLLGALPKNQRPKDFESITQALQTVHEEASGILGTKWALPGGILWVVGHHHSYYVDGRVSPLAALICLSDWLAAEAGAPGFNEADEASAMDAMEYFGFDGPAQSRLVDKCCRIVEELP